MTLGTRALDPALRVRAKVRAASVVLDTLVNVLAGPVIPADSISRGTRALVSAIMIYAVVRARIIQDHALVHILASPAVAL